MTDIKKINRQFLLNLIFFIVIVLSCVGMGIWSFFFIENDDYIYLVLFLLLIVLLITSGIFRNKIDSITNTSYIIKIRHHASDPIVLNKRVSDIEKTLHTMGFQSKINKKAYVLYYRVVLDDIKRIFKRHMLEVVVISRGGHFFIDEVNEDIDNLHSTLLKEKKKTDKLFVTQIREIETLSDEVKEQIKEIAFIRTARGIISIVNIGIHLPTNTAVMLYSDTYRPSLYYEYHINEIKKMLK